MGRVMRVGVFGGSFDPPHLGHLILAELARDQLGLDQMLWVPAGDPPHKRERKLSSVEHRLAMVRLCISDNVGFGLSLVDVERAGPHYTADMLRLLADEHTETEPFLVIGGDSLRDLPTWYQPNEVIQRAKLIVMSRPNTSYDLASLEESIPGLTHRTLFLDAPSIEISARDIRMRAHEKRSIRYLVSDSVCNYILLHSLYQDYVE
jgi:nicotinate-nucleotide adenylyltransferase